MIDRPHAAVLKHAVVSVTIALSALVCDGARAQMDAPTGVETCTLEPGSTHTVARIIDGETLALDDGSEVRLIGALAPRASDTGAAPNAWPAEQQAMRTLSNLVLGRSVRLAYGGRRYDRYGRHLAHVFVRDNGAETWVQGAMLVTGNARAYTLPDSAACANELLAHERLARLGRAGLWANLVYRPKPAERAALVISRRSHFEIVEGVVASVSRLKSGIYLNFGREWRSDFTARIGKKTLARHDDLNRLLADVAGKHIVVRGWIERRNGPAIDVTDPGQIEIRSTPDGLPPVAQGANSSATEPARGPLPQEQPASGKGEDRPSDTIRPDEPIEVRPGAVDL